MTLDRKGSRVSGGAVEERLASWETEGIWATMGSAVAEAVPDLMLIVDRAGIILYVNRAEGGIPREKVIGSRAFDYAPLGLRDELAQSLVEIFAGAKARVREVYATLPDGSQRWYATHTGPLMRDGQVLAATVIARDVTEMHAAQLRLSESEERYRTIFEQAPDAIVVLDLDRVSFIDANRSACALFGMTREQLLRENPMTVSPVVQTCGRPSAAVAWEHLAEAMGGGTPTFDWVHRAADGTNVQCIVRLARLPWAGRRLVHGSITNVTDQRALEEQVRQWQKLEAVGHLAGGIAHDFNNLLTVISGEAEAMLMGGGLAPEHQCYPEAQAIADAARRGTALTRRLLDFAQQGDGAPCRVDLNEVATDATAWLNRLLTRTVELVQQLQPGAAPVTVSRDRLEQVLLNLVVNARDAMPAGGTVTISTAEVVRDELFVHTHPGARVGRHIRLSVGDTGTGMSEDVKARLFEPFFTTKKSDGGTGLGLSIVYGIVRRSGGHIEIESEIARGTTIHIYLPLAALPHSHPNFPS